MSAVAVDSGGSLYIADTANNLIEKVDHSTGNIAVVGGTGLQGKQLHAGDGQPARTVTLNYPFGIAVDGAGNVFFSDSLNYVLRIDASSGILTTVAGTGTCGSSGDGGAASLAALCRPEYLAVDGSGNLYILDEENVKIRKVAASNGMISTVAGPSVSSAGYGIASFALDHAGNLFVSSFDGTLSSVDQSSGNAQVVMSSALLKGNAPGDMRFDNEGYLYASVPNPGTNTVLKIDMTAKSISVFAGQSSPGYTGDGGPAASAELNRPLGIAIDAANNVYIADSNNLVVREVTPSGIISTAAGSGAPYYYSGDGGPAVAAELTSPFGLAVDGKADLIVADTNNHVVRRIAAATGIITTIAGTGVDAYAGNGVAATSACLHTPQGVAVDVAGNIYIADPGSNDVRKVSPDGIISTLAGTGEPGYSGDGNAAINSKLNRPTNVAVDETGNVYIADTANNVIRKVDASTGVIVTVAGNGLAGFSGDQGPATSAKLRLPDGIAVDHSGNLYIADEQNLTIRKVDASGTITSIAFGFAQPTSVAISASGDLYVTDTGNNIVRRVNLPSGQATTVAGNGNYGYSGDGGLATSSELNGPTGLAIDSSGNLYISDTANNEVRVVAGEP